MVNNFITFMLVGIFCGLIIFGVFKLIKFLVGKKKKKEDTHTL